MKTKRPVTRRQKKLPASRPAGRTSKPAVRELEHYHAKLGPVIPESLEPAEFAFCLEYLANGFNATQAYQKSHPQANAMTARTEGYRCLTKPHIRAHINEQLEKAWKPLQMGGEQALARVARIAAADIRDLYDEKGELLKPHLWPDSIACCVKSVKDGPYGLTVTLESTVGALRIVLEQTGKLKGTADSIDALAAILRENYKANGFDE